MTAEVAILNRSGIAIAADSAVTIGGERVWMSTNKIFSLGPTHDMAVMVFGSGDFAGVPWETIIQAFREQSAVNDYPMVADAVEDFKIFLARDRWRDNEHELLANSHFIASQIEFLNDGLAYDDEGQFQKEFSAEANRWLAELQDRDVILKGLTIEKFKKDFSQIIVRFIEEITGFAPADETAEAVFLFLFEAFRRPGITSGFETGLVFLGFGRDQIYPVVNEHMIDGRYDEEIRIMPSRFIDLNIDKNKEGVIITFAQTDMTSLFMEGILEQYSNFYETAFESLLEEKTSHLLQTYVQDDDERVVENAIQARQNAAILAELQTAVSSLKQHEIINPLIEAIRALPREEMTAMAEAFVELTSMRRKVDSKLQTVGGPVDVVFISKSDGLTWIKRKLYFDATLNRDFFDRRRTRLKRV